MVKIHLSVNDTWMITNENLKEIEPKSKNSHKNISKFNVAFRNVFYNFRLGRSFDYHGVYEIECYIFGSKTTANISMSIKNSNVKHTFKNVTSCSDSSFVLPRRLFDPVKEIIANGHLEIEITGLFIIERDEYPAIPNTYILSDELWKNKEKDFDIIVATGKDADGEANVQVHKEVLSVQSPVFEAMLNSGMKETKTNTLKIIDFNFKTVNLAVEFFYGHEIPTSLIFEDIFDLYRFADKYCVDNLIEYITKFISYRISPSNITEILSYSTVPYFEEKLKKHCSHILDLCSELSISIDGSNK